MTTNSPWGIGSYGEFPYGGGASGAGGHIPNTEQFDIYSVGQEDTMLSFLEYIEVAHGGVSGQFLLDYGSKNYIFISDSTTLYSGSISTARVSIDKAVPEMWTFEFHFVAESLPEDFSNVTASHIFFGTVDRQGSSAGVFVSEEGIMYTGSVWYDSSGKLHLNSTTQKLPGTAGMIVAGTEYTMRIAVDDPNGITYIFLSATADIPVTGLMLRFVLPSIPSSASSKIIEDGTYISVCGTETHSSRMWLDTIALATGLYIPNLPPIADAGKDQSARKCSIVRLDGRSSFDPEGSSLQYRWWLTSAPSSSSFIVEADDGSTPEGGEGFYTNRLFSETLREYDDGEETEVAIGDVIWVFDKAYDIINKGTDGGSFFVDLSSYELPVGQSNVKFRFLKQNSISNSNTAQPTFYPDTVGIFRLQLMVHDGQLWSQPSTTILNVLESVVPRGITPNVSFLWDYLSDFWNVVQDKDHITTFWGALAQIAASELLSLWQIEYNKSLRDIQKTFQRKWLHYDLRILEQQKELSSIRWIAGGVYLEQLPEAGADLSGKTLLFNSGALTSQLEVEFTGDNPITTYEAADQIEKKLLAGNKGFIVEVVTNAIFNHAQIRIRAPFPFEVDAASTATDLMPSITNNDQIKGTDGRPLGSNLYLVDKDLSGLDIKVDDLLVVDGTAYRIAQVMNNPDVDDWKWQRVSLKDEIPLTAGATWRICGGTSSNDLDFYSALLFDGDQAVFEVINSVGQIAYFEVDVYGASSIRVNVLATDLWPLAWYLYDSDNYDVFLFSVHRRKYMPVDPLIVATPILQEKITGSPEEEILRENVDYFIEEYRGLKCVRFVVGDSPDPDVWQYSLPPARMWAEVTYIDNRPTIEANFGIPADFVVDDLEAIGKNVDYLSAVRGIWYLYLFGPTIRNLRIGTQILLGLPFAEEAGTIEEISTDFSSSQSRILVRDAASEEIVRFYTYPRILELEVNPDTGEKYKVGDTVKQFAPLVEGVEVVDYVKDPIWFQGYMNQGLMYEVEKFFKFLVRVDSSAFSLSALLFAESFIKKIKPTYTHPMFVLRYNVNQDGDEVDVTDDITFYPAHGEASRTQTRLTLQDDIGRNGGGTFMSIDDPKAAGGSWMGQVDSGWPITDRPVFPAITQPCAWGADKSDLVPEDGIIVVESATVPAGTVPTVDIFLFVDTPVFFGTWLMLDRGNVDFIPASSHPLYPLVIGEPHLQAGGPLSIQNYCLKTAALGSNSAINIRIWATVDGAYVPDSLVTATIPAGRTARVDLTCSAPWVVPDGSTARFYMAYDGADGIALDGWMKILLCTGNFAVFIDGEGNPTNIWVIDLPVAAGTHSNAELL